MIIKKIHIKNMLCNCCLRIVREDFERNNIKVNKLRLAYAEISFNELEMNLQKVDEILNKLGMGVIINREQRIVEETKQAIIDLIHHMNNVDSIVRKSEYLVEKLGRNYQQLSKLFSKYEDITLEKFTIKNKILRIKELIIGDEYSLSEIAFMMDYSSVQYLSNQFKKETGMTVSEFKKK